MMKKSYTKMHLLVTLSALSLLESSAADRQPPARRMIIGNRAAPQPSQPAQPVPSISINPNAGRGFLGQQRNLAAQQQPDQPAQPAVLPPENDDQDEQGDQAPAQAQNMETILILSIDGGGYRGVVAAQILAQMEKLLRGKQVYEFIDVIGGTSVGSIIAATLNTPIKDGKPLTAQETLEFFTKMGGKIFNKPLLRTVRTVGGVLSARYSAKPLEAELLNIFQNKTLENAIHPMALTSFAIEYKIPYNFYSTQTQFKNILLRDALRASTAAPVYFHPIPLIVPGLNTNGVPQKVLLADGGLSATSPQSVVYRYAKTVYPNTPAQPRQYVIISVSTGKPVGKQFTLPTKKILKPISGGALRMVLPTIHGALDSQINTSSDDILHASDVVDFYRVNVELPNNCAALDKPQNHACLIQAAQTPTVSKKAVTSLEDGTHEYNMVPTTFSALIHKIASIKNIQAGYAPQPTASE